MGGLGSASGIAKQKGPNMPARSQAQQHLFGMLYANPGMAKERGINMSREQLREFAATKTKNLPSKIGDPKKKSVWKGMKPR